MFRFRFVLLVAWGGVALTLTGCGAKYVPVEGVVRLDGQPLDGATVVFTSEDGKKTFSGFTDAGGAFSLGGGEKPGALPGTYKVTVTKKAALKGDENSGAGSDAYLKQRKGGLSEAEKAGGPGTKMMMPGAGGKIGMPAVGKSSGAPASTKSELPAPYASVSSTPFTVQVPSEGPVQLDLKSKP